MSTFSAAFMWYQSRLLGGRETRKERETNRKTSESAFIKKLGSWEKALVVKVSGVLFNDLGKALWEFTDKPGRITTHDGEGGHDAVWRKNRIGQHHAAVL